MTLPVNIQLFDEDTPADTNLLNANFRKLAAAINDIAGTTVVNFQTLPGDETSGFLPVTGGTMSGTLIAPGISIIDGQSSIPVVKEGDMATTVKAGLVKQGIHVQKISEGATTDAAIDGLIQSLRDQGLIANAG